MRLLIFLFIGFIFLISCKKDKQTEPAISVEIPLYDCRLQLQGLRDAEGKDVSLTNPIKLVVTDAKNDTVYTDYFTNNKMDIKFRLPSGAFMINVFDTTETFAPYTIKEEILPQKGSYLNRNIGLSKFPPYKISLVSINDTVINNQKGILLHVSTPTTKDTVYYLANYFKKPLSYPITSEYFNSLLPFNQAINGQRKWFYPISEPAHEFINKGEVYYFSVVEVARDWLSNSRNDNSISANSYNATGKVVQNFQFINY